jgi:hypothetical protein
MDAVAKGKNAEEPKGFLAKMGHALSYGTSVDIHEVGGWTQLEAVGGRAARAGDACVPTACAPAPQVIEEDELVAAIHENAVQFDPKAEAAFAYLQVGVGRREGVVGGGGKCWRAKPSCIICSKGCLSDSQPQWRIRPPLPVQVFSAICVIFSHGAGEVGYMTGPLGAIWQVG